MPIRPYAEADLDAVLEIWHQASLIAHAFLPPEFFETERLEIANRWLPVADTIIHESEAGIEGFLALIDNEVGAIFVRPEVQGHGVGRSLMDAAARTRPYLEVGVFEANPIGRRFYDAYGFEFVARQVCEVTGEPELRLRLESGPSGVRTSPPP